jgi:aquaporin Z
MADDLADPSTDRLGPADDPSGAATLGQRLAAETLGTFVLVLLGVGAALMSGGDYLATALGFGLAALVMVGAVGHVSGGHFNPAISLGASLAGRLRWRHAWLYWAVQVGGGILAGLVLWVLMQGFPGFSTELGFGQNSFGDHSPTGYAWWAALLIETVMTALLVIVVLAITDDRQQHPVLVPIVIGLTLAGIHLASISATGTSVNPARSIGANLFAGRDAVLQLWLFLLAPMLGGAIAGLAYPLVFGRDAEPVPGSGVRRVSGRRGPSTGDPRPSAVAEAAAWPSSWPDPGPPREWGQPAAPSDGPRWRPPAGAVGGRTPPEPEPTPNEHGFLPPPSEPYWSQQLPQAEDDDPDEGEDRTRIRPSDGT